MKVKKHRSLVFALSLGLILAGCAVQYTPPPTQLEIREIQTREFDTNNSKMVIKAMMNVLQDDGYIIKNVVADMGLLSAEKNVDIEDKCEAILSRLNDGALARWNKMKVIEASANVSEFGEKTRVRINFQIKTIDNFGCPKNVEMILDDEMYRAFFNKVDKGIFIQKENI